MNETKIRLFHPLVEGSHVEADEVWAFPDGLLGVGGPHQFALVPLPGAEPFELLCSAEESTFGIVLVDPRRLVPDYVLALPPDEIRPIAEADPDRLEIRVPVRLPDGSTPMSLNLKGPILLSPRERIGVQRISSDDDHPVRFTLDFTGSGTPSCSS